MEQHVKTLGILYIVIGGLGVTAALIVFGVFGGIAGVARAGEHGEAVPLLLLLGGVRSICSRNFTAAPSAASMLRKLQA